MKTVSTLTLRLSSEEAEMVEALKAATGLGHSSKAIMYAVSRYGATQRELHELRKSEEQLKGVISAYKRAFRARTQAQVTEDIAQNKILLYDLDGSPSEQA